MEALRRVVVTGMGVVSPLGNKIKSFWNALASGKSGIGFIENFDASKYPSRIAAHVRDIDFSNYVDLKNSKRTEKHILYAIAASGDALKDASVNFANLDPESCGVIIGCSMGGMAIFEREYDKHINKGFDRVSPFFVPMFIPDMPSGLVSIKYGIKGPNYAVVSACASSSHAIGDAFMAIRSGMMEMTVTGGTEAAITPMNIAAFSNMKALSTRNDSPEKASSPFDKKRDGFVMGEGAGIIVLESLEHAIKRNATIYAELVGYGATGDAHHLSEPAPEGEGAARSMRMALKCAKLEPSYIDYINAHGTSTPKNDKYESCAIKSVFAESADRISVSSTKSMTGHLLGAAGAIEFIASVLAIKYGVIPPTINYEDPDPDCPLDYTPNVAVKRNVKYAMSNSFGFGGHNSSLILKEYSSNTSIMAN